MKELIGEMKFISKCSGNTKTINHKKSESQGASMEHESRSMSRSICSEQGVADDYGFRPSLKNLEKLDLMPDIEVVEVVDKV